MKTKKKRPTTFDSPQRSDNPIVGYVDDYGYLYCERHSSSQMTAIRKWDDQQSGFCEVCGKEIYCLDSRLDEDGNL